MLDPCELLALARALAREGSSHDANLRRAISTAYYALFHATLKAAAERFVGARDGAGAAYRLLYRGFSHGRMRDICVALDRATLSPRYQQLLGRSAVSRPVRDYAWAFRTLQERRHLADYDPQTSFHPEDAIDACDGAELAMQALTRIDPPELTDILALLLVESRA